MLACWAVAREEEAPGRGFSRSGFVFLPLWEFLRAYLAGFGCLVPGLYEVIPNTLSLFASPRGLHRRPLGAGARMLADRSELWIGGGGGGRLWAALLERGKPEVAKYQALLNFLRHAP